MLLSVKARIKRERTAGHRGGGREPKPYLSETMGILSPFKLEWTGGAAAWIFHLWKLRLGCCGCNSFHKCQFLFKLVVESAVCCVTSHPSFGQHKDRSWNRTGLETYLKVPIRMVTPPFLSWCSGANLMLSTYIAAVPVLVDLGYFHWCIPEAWL